MGVEFIPLSKLTFPEWVRKYREDIRCCISWDRLWEIYPSVSHAVFTGQTRSVLHFVWYDDGSWNIGRAKTYCPQTDYRNVGFIRVPGVVHEKSFTILDGTHRILQFRPTIVAVDYVRADTEDIKRCFVDLFRR